MTPGPSTLRVPIMRNPETQEDILGMVRRRYQRLTKRQEYTAQLYNDQGSQYLVQIGVGTPPQNFTVTLDTGSADLWIPASECPKKSCPFARFQEDRSTTFKDLQSNFGIQYGIGNVNGTYATDTVTVGGASVQNQQFGLATTTQDILTNPTPGDGSSTGGNTPANASGLTGNGILGLGYPQLTAATTQGQQAYTPFVFNLVKQSVIQEPIFSIYLNSLAKKEWAGEIMFGGIDQSKYTGDLTYLPVATLQNKPASLPEGDSTKGRQGDSGGYYYWMVYGQGISVRNGLENPDFQLKRVGAFILDTGTTLTYLPTDVAIQIARSIVGDSGFQVDRQSGVIIIDCAASQSPATVQLQMSQTKSITNNPVVLTVPARELIIPLTSSSSSSSDRTNTCLFGIAPMSGNGALGSEMFLIGDSILRSAYLVFDMGKNRVGIATAKGVGGSVNGNNTTAESTSNLSATTALSGWPSCLLLISLIFAVMPAHLF
ncbi:aspartic peptidase domain-containing protein [Radiomyces spectabilis]|uniref:aspartic peptidase domain-containing protein n=1 Tax=Radiomyces spectabilis TaxID=64574 RepID=UPI0022208B24|nr:aspartic peptidase domain-containing protein [Radiomyces spectabilis]KAI8370631.1 aspartic peptidase domain-containing protein [Radiomyces spectabilis]